MWLEEVSGPLSTFLAFSGPETPGGIQDYFAHRNPVNLLE